MSARLTVAALQVTTAASASPLLGPIEFTLGAGECLGLVGESGSGKSLTALALIGLLPPGLSAQGQLRIEDANVDIAHGLPRALRGRRLAWMPQDPLASLHPLRTVGAQLLESLRALRKLSRAEASAEARALFTRLQLPDPESLRHRYPHQLSGGQRQRVGLALALAGDPAVLIADEPTSALDPRLARESLDLLDGLRRERGLAVLLISHDLPSVRAYAARVLVLQRGQVVEQGDSARVFSAPAHAYTRALLAADQLPAPAARLPGARLLQVESVSVRYPRAARPALLATSFDLHRGQCLALVGESGSGKSSLGRAILRLMRGELRGRVRLDGDDLLSAPRPLLRRLRRRMGIVFQDPYASLDPRQRIAEAVAEPLRLAGIGSADEQRQRAADLLAQVGLDATALDRYPHEFSGGQRQRIAIARALAADPELLICDEAVSALDAQHRAEILQLLATLRRERGLAMLFITHDLAAARSLADRIAVLDQGELVELGDADQVLNRPVHAATRALVAPAAAATSPDYPTRGNW